VVTQLALESFKDGWNVYRPTVSRQSARQPMLLTRAASAVANPDQPGGIGESSAAAHLPDVAGAITFRCDRALLVMGD